VEEPSASFIPASVLTEGFRRKFQFERKWHAFYTAALNLRELKNAYKVQKARFVPGTSQRWALLDKLVEQWQAIVKAEMQAFFDTELRAATERARPEDKPPSQI
jgi:hypothetical protein